MNVQSQISRQGLERHMQHVEMRAVSKRYGDVHRHQQSRPDGRQGRVLRAARPIRLRQVDDAAHDRRAGGGHPGSVFINGANVTRLHPAKRRIAMVFQSYALYPHLTVRHNIAFSLSVAGASQAVQTKRADEIAALLQLDQLMDRKPAQLSGGQRQRVAIGRALVREPEVFLFDEPLSNLDAMLRVQMRIELAKLHKTLGTTMIYVTHDQVEAMTLADRIVVLDRGVIAQIGAPLELYSRPDNKFVASFIGSPTMNFLAVTPRSVDGRNITLGFDRVGGTSASTLVVAARSALDGAHAEPAEIGIRPEHIAIADTSDARAHLTGVVQLVERLGNLTIVYVSTPAGLLVVEGSGEMAIRVDDSVGLTFDASRTHVFGRDGRVI